MDRQDVREHLVGMAVVAFTVMGVSLYQMEFGTALERLAAGVVLTVSCWAMCLGTIRLLASRAVLGLAALAAGLLVLYGFHLTGGFAQVGF